MFMTKAVASFIGWLLNGGISRLTIELQASSPSIDTSIATDRQFSGKELDNLRSQFVTSSHGGIR